MRAHGGNVKTFGRLKIVIDDATHRPIWEITAEPHVAIRAKRTFASAAVGTKGVVELSMTHENARDIEWFCDRFALEMDEDVAARLKKDADAFRERETLLARLLDGVEPPRPFELAVPARDYQRVAAEMWLRMGGLLLADDLGLGKTCSAICGLTDPNTRPALVVTQTHLTRQWARELKRFAPHLRVHVLKKGRPYDLTKKPRERKKQSEQLEIPLARASTFPDVVVTNYHKLHGWAKELAVTCKSVVFDEVQELRHGTKSRKGEVATQIAAGMSYRLGLSATPIYNLGGEIHNVMEALAPGRLGTRSEFLREHCKGSDDQGGAALADPKAFGLFMRDSGLMLRRTKADVGMQAEDVVRIPHDIDCDLDALRDIESAAERLAEVILVSGQNRGDRMHASAELSALVRHATGVSKAPYVAEFVKLLVEQGEQVVLFGWHRSVYDIWMTRLAKLNPVLFTGSESGAAKDRAAQRFISGESKVLIMSLRSGVGLDGLQNVSRTIVFGELDWSPGVMEQDIGRLDRPGQERQVIAYYLLAPEGSDPLVADLLQVKRTQVEGIRNPSGELLQHLEVDGERIKRLAQQYLRSRPKVWQMPDSQSVNQQQGDQS